ncbi:MAG TPA: nucleotidyltransferase domain-containing protein [Allosphingosinicella sp.]|nr:nucleotidyltransferase domain-containing protein [Allosphingosinicella sp.]
MMSGDRASEGKGSHWPRSQGGRVDELDRKVTSRLRSAVKDCFGPKCKAAWLSGSAAYGGARVGFSDIDVIIVFGERVTSPADSETIILIKRFVDEYLALHADLGLQPDLDFPGEFLTERLIQQASDGRGFTREGNPPRLALPPIESAECWLDCPDRWFRAWLGMTAFSRHFAGSRHYHSAVKLDAWKTVLRYVLLAAGSQSLLPDEVFEGLAEFGLKPSYRTFRTLETEWVQRAMAQLEAEAVVRLAHGRLHPCRAGLRAWEAHVCEHFAEGAPLPLLLDIHNTRRLSAYAATRWTALG